MYYRLFKEAYGPSPGDIQVEHLKSQADVLNSEMHESDSLSNDKDYIAVELDDDDIVIAVCTPLMKRVHQMIQQSG